MAGASINKYFLVVLLLIGIACTQADDTGESKIDMETFASRNQLLHSVINESLTVASYIFERSNELCQKMLADETYNHTTSQQLQSAEKILNKCVNHVVDRIDLNGHRHGDDLNEILLRKYGFEDIQKIANQKYDDLFKEVVRQIDEYVKALTPAQQSRTTARNLRMWSSKIKDAQTLAGKDMAFNKCMRFYIFERGV